MAFTDNTTPLNNRTPANNPRNSFLNKAHTHRTNTLKANNSSHMEEHNPDNMVNHKTTVPQTQMRLSKKARED